MSEEITSGSDVLQKKFCMWWSPELLHVLHAFWAQRGADSWIQHGSDDARQEWRQGKSSFAQGSWKENTTFVQLSPAGCEAAGAAQTKFTCAELRRCPGLGGQRGDQAFLGKSRALENEILQPICGWRTEMRWVTKCTVRVSWLCFLHSARFAHPFPVGRRVCVLTSLPRV